MPDLRQLLFNRTLSSGKKFALFERRYTWTFDYEYFMTNLEFERGLSRLRKD